MRPTADLRQGEALDVLRTLPTSSVDAVIADPPYSSGGFTRGDRTAPTGVKYVSHGTAVGRTRHDFGGDSRDSRSWGYWTALWLAECLRIVKPGGYALMFCDWRQLPTATDAFQAGGFIWRGLISWDKGRGARAPHKGYFRHQCEYILWGSNGALPKADWSGPWDGSHTIPVKQSEKVHQTGKPTNLMLELVQCCPPGGTVLDPFMGSGTTGLAAVATKRNFIGVEQSPAIFETARARVSALLDVLGKEVA